MSNTRNNGMALASDRYGGPERLKLVDTAAVPPRTGEIQIAVRAVSLNRSDLLAMRGEPFFLRIGNGLTRPRNTIPGSDIAGTVTSVGDAVTNVDVGEAVVADLSDLGRGGLSEYVTIPSDHAVGIPETVDFDTAASLPTAGVTAYQALKPVAHLAPGERVLIDGASGGVGSFAIQIARIIGAEVTAVVGPRNVATARSLGASRVIDYSREDLIEAVSEKDSGIFDVIYAVNGHRSLSEYQRVLSPDGRFVMTGGSGSLMFQTMLGGRRFRFHTMKPHRADLERLLQYVASGRLTPMISDRFTLQETATAFQILDDGHASGKIVVTVPPKGDIQ
jgi:NADPH:quinone reductase-like Zn-dependent oxidoreductase